MRSGSSFLGEFFNVHPEAFYMFEPLHALDGFCGHHENLTDCIQLLEDHLSCKFEDRFDQTMTWREFATFNPDIAESPKKYDLMGNFIFRHKSKRLCRYPFCG